MGSVSMEFLVLGTVLLSFYICLRCEALENLSISNDSSIFKRWAELEKTVIQLEKENKELRLLQMDCSSPTTNISNSAERELDSWHGQTWRKYTTFTLEIPGCYKFLCDDYTYNNLTNLDLSPKDSDLFFIDVDSGHFYARESGLYQFVLLYGGFGTFMKTPQMEINLKYVDSQDVIIIPIEKGDSIYFRRNNKDDTLKFIFKNF